jgi:peptidoglycan/LPS O-acetylase OafA/YrhL
MVMKRSNLALIISGLVILAAILWFVRSEKPVNVAGIAQIGIILILTGFGIYVGISRLKSEKRGEPAEDELSKKILQKASSKSYYISLYMWLVFMYLSDKLKWETNTLVGAGIVGMAILFLVCWVIFKIKGVKDV